MGYKSCLNYLLNLYKQKKTTKKWPFCSIGCVYFLMNFFEVFKVLASKTNQ